MGKYTEIKKNFLERYNKNIKPFLNDFEIRRRRHLILAVLFSLVSFLAGVLAVIIPIAIALCTSGGGKIHIRINEFVIFSIILPVIIIQIFKKKFENELKQKTMYAICSCFGKLSWSQGNKYFSSIPADFFSKSYLVDSYNSTFIDDSFKGEYEDCVFELFEIKLTQQDNNEKSSKTIFSGIIIKIILNESFKTHTIVRPDGLLHFNKGNLKHTELEDVVFEKKYDVYTDNEIEARVLITPALMDRINNIQKVFEAKKTSFAFYQNNILIALSVNKDMFDIGNLFKPFKDGSAFLNLFNEILSIYKLIDYLKLIKNRT